VEQIAEQLKEEINSLREYIQQTEERIQVTGWVAELLDPFDHVEGNFSDGELRQVVEALYQARNRFSVNGHLSTRIDSILERYDDITTLLKADSPIPEAPPRDLPAKDPDFSGDLSTLSIPEDEDEETDLATSLFAAEDEGGSEASSPSQEKDEEGGDLFTPLSFDEVGDSSQVLSNGSEAEAEEDFASAFSVADEPLDLDPIEAEDLFGPLLADEPEPEPETALPVEKSPSAAPIETGTPEGLAPGTLFNSPPPTPSSPAPVEEQRKGKKVHQPPSKSQRPRPAPADAPGQVDIFATKISLDDLLLRLDLSIPEQDKTQLQNLLRNKLADRAISALKANPQFEKQFNLVPRLTRYVYDGTLYACTIKNLVMTFIALFGNIRDLVQFKDHRFFNAEVPEPGWALVPAEAPRETLGKTFMEQTQYLRYLAANAGIPSHLVRRRTLVEAVYDIIVGRIVLGSPFHKQTLDWTSSGTSKSDFACVYYAENGVRLRSLPRTTHNPALGVVPNL
jgi:hypothetical protein